MNGARVLSLVLGSVALLAATSSACTNVYGIPGECRMRVLVCDVPGGSAALPAEVSSVLMDENRDWSACSPSHDGAVNVVSVPEGFDVHYRGRRRLIPRGAIAGQLMEWDSSERRFAFWAPLEPGKPPRKRVAVCDVRNMSASPAYQTVYEAPETSAAFGFAWVPDRDELLVIERRLVGGVSAVAVVLVDLATRAVRDLVVEEGGIDFVVTTHHGSAGGSPRALVGSPSGLKVVDCVTGVVQRLPGLPGIGVFNLELSRDGQRAVVFYRRPVPAEDGRTFAGVYLFDLPRLLAGDPEGATLLHDGRDIHTLWFGPDGDEVLWATPWDVYRRRVEPSAATRTVFSAGRDGPEIKGAAYDATGARIAITLGNRLLVNDSADGVTTEVASFGDAARTFAAEPRWINGKVMVSLFEELDQARPLPRPTDRGRRPR